MKTRYTLVLTAGGCVNGALPGKAEALHRDNLIESFLSYDVIAIHRNLGMLTVDLSTEEYAALSTDWRVHSIYRAYGKHVRALQQNAGWALAYICDSLYNSYEYNTTGIGVYVYVQDSGINELVVPCERLGVVPDNAGDTHGTHVAYQVKQVAKNVSIVDVPMQLTDGVFELADVLSAYDAILADTRIGDRIVNLSFGSYSADSTPEDLAVQALITAGFKVVAAAGDDSQDAGQHVPSRVTGVVSVGALGQDGLPTPTSNFGTRVDTFAPGTAVPSFIDTFAGSSCAAAMVSGILARALELAPASSPILANPAKANPTCIGTTLGANTGKARTWWLDEYGVKQYGPWVACEEIAIAAVLQRTAYPVVQGSGVLPQLAPAIAGSTPTSPNGGSTALIALTVPKDETSTYSIQLSYPSGTFSLSGIFAVPYSRNQVVNLQGLTGTVKRTGLALSRSDAGNKVEGRILPNFTQELISVKKAKGKYKVSDLVKLVADKAGTTVDFRGSDTVLDIFDFAGRFTEVLSQLATEACAVLLQQNGKWFILPVDEPVGAYSVLADDIISCSQVYQTDILDEIIDLIDRYLAALKDLGDAKRALDAFEDALAPDAVTPLSEVGAKVRLQNITFDFGRKNQAFKSIDNAYQIVGGLWDYWEGASAGKLNDYYQVCAEPMRGCANLDKAVIRVEVQEPSNASGLYFAKGKLINLAAVFWNGDEDDWALITPTFLGEQQKDGSIVRKMYFDFEILPIAWNQPSDAYIADYYAVAEGDGRFYVCDLELAYLPIAFNGTTFKGTIYKKEYVVLKDGKIAGALPRDGGTLISTTGKVVWEYDAETAAFMTQNGATQANLVGNNIVSVDGPMYAQLADGAIYPIRNDSGAVIGAINDNGTIYNAAMSDVGSYAEPRWVSATGTVRVNGVIGAIYAGDTDTPRISVVTNVTATSGDALYAQAAADSIATDRAMFKLKLEIATQKLVCLEKALIRYKVDISALRLMGAAWTTFYDYKYGEAPTTASRLQELEEAAQADLDALLQQISASDLKILVTELVLLYISTMPLPGNALMINHPNVLVSDAGIVETVNFNASAGSCTITISSKSWT